MMSQRTSRSQNRPPPPGAKNLAKAKQPAKIPPRHKRDMVDQGDTGKDYLGAAPPRRRIFDGSGLLRLASTPAIPSPESKEDETDEDYEYELASKVVEVGDTTDMDVDDPPKGPPARRLENGSDVAIRKAMAAIGSVAGPTLTEQIFEIPMAFWGQLTTTAGNLLVNLANNDPTLATNWANAATVFNQYRVIEYEMFLVPMYDVNAVAAPVMQCLTSYIDEDDATTVPTAQASAMAHADTLRVQSGYETCHRIARPINPKATNPDDTWNDCLNPVAATHAIKFVCVTSLTSTVAWNIVVRWRVQFRGLGA
jgi:hypothetical protein